MGERCRCGAELLPHLHFCVGCGADRQAASPHGPQPTLHAEPVPPLPGPVTNPGRGYAVPAWNEPAWNEPAWNEPAWNAPAPAAWQPPPPPGWQAPVVADRWQPEPTPRRSSPAPWLIALSVLVVLLLSASAVLVTLRPELVGLGSEPVVTPAAAAPAVTPRSAAPTLSPRDELAAQVDRDRSQVEAVNGRWVPQLSSKKPGTVDNGVTYDDASILAHYRGVAARYPGTALLWSGDWPVFKQSDYWVVISTQSFPSAAQANAWCDAQGFSRDDCLAKKLSHSGGTAGTTVPR